MSFNLITNIQSCYVDVPQLVYYAHIPTAIASLLVGFFVYIKNRDLGGKILLFISIVFSLWVSSNLYLWLGHDSRLIIFVWSLFGILNSLLFLLSLYFAYIFIKKGDVILKFKIFWTILIAPIVITSYQSLSNFNLMSCEANSGWVYFGFVYAIELLIALWILVYGIYKYVKEKTDFRKQILLLVVGIELFFFSFSVTGFLASYLAEKGVSYAFEIEQYGLFGMTVFLGFLGYLIVKFKAFNIKLLSAQALVVAQFILIASMFAFTNNFTSQVLIGVTLTGTTIMGWYMVRSVKAEVKRKEELQLMSEKLSQANDQLRKLDNAKSEFISIASHQLRTPLTAIKGFVSLILEGTYGEVLPQVREALNKVYLSGERLINLVENLLSISRIESGRMEYQMSPVHLEATLKELVDNFTIIAINKGLKLEIKLPKDPLPEIMADQIKIREVISNFIDNALKYTNEGKVTVRA